ncbi:DHA1 family chloramphenicol resistance protein-like MFS transporter [Saccharothrix ecbatanensis]|uniref:DHA1 family chloramphenicol resistance protein-like MFS transporter n=1 Tax=Saccharothrix ecbatanensis TaxID=1105145 RepID=A0A7W9HL19_9PSEU|nr:MFS transporter [Saccharothrix ecbatanensis]MBB5804076.1 DHA1 family chloramphenicol resistance protein-like MFS transporter [Saccharothrix ecbatanensis]
MSAEAVTQPAVDSGKRLPLGVYLLAFSLLAMGSAEFLVAGVLPAIADDLAITLPAAGALITAFAIAVVIGGPPMAVLTLRWPRRTTLVVTQLLFAAAVAVSLLVDDYAVILVARFVCGIAYAGFWAVAAVTAISLVPPERTARASGVVVSGLSIAMLAGGPASALLSYYTGWRGGFWAVFALTLIGAILTAAAVPATKSAVEPGVRQELRAMKQPRLYAVYAATLLSTASYMITYNYLAPLLTDVTGLGAVWVPPILTLFGIGAFVGLSIGGRIADARPFHALLIGAIGIGVSSVLLALLAEHDIAVIVLVVLMGIAGFVLNPAIYGRVFTLAGQAPTLAGSTAVSMFQLGISLVPVFAGIALSAGAEFTAIPWIGAGLAVLTVPAVLVDRTITRRRAAADRAV